MEDSPLTLGRIFRFWLPLAATWLMMAVEGPFLAAIIARLAEPTFNLAAYGVAYALALVVEAPVIMLLSLSTALARNRDSYLRLRTFTHVLNTTVTAAMAVTLAPPVFDWLASDLIGLPPEVASRTHLALLILLPWPATIGLRRFYQGILIRHDLTRLVAYGTVIRLAAMATTAGLLALSGTVDGAAVGAAALTAGVTAESVAAWVMARRSVRRLLDTLEPARGAATSYRGLARFYYPLALTTLLSLGIQPVVTFFVGNSRAAIESLAVLPVVSALVFIFRALGLAYQEVVIALIGDEQNGYRCLRHFALVLATAVLGVLAVIVWTPLATVWFETVSGLTPELAAFAVPAARILAPIAGLTALLSFQRAVLVARGTTEGITWATVIEVVGVVVVLWIAISGLDVVGAIAATAALLIGRLGANVYLAPALRTARSTDV
jgi:O-antigen/teichoic acid export membrane protein